MAWAKWRKLPQEPPLKLLCRFDALPNVRGGIARDSGLGYINQQQGPCYSCNVPFIIISNCSVVHANHSLFLFLIENLLWQPRITQNQHFEIEMLWLMLWVLKYRLLYALHLQVYWSLIEIDQLSLYLITWLIWFFNHSAFCASVRLSLKAIPYMRTCTLFPMTLFSRASLNCSYSLKYLVCP